MYEIPRFNEDLKYPQSEKKQSTNSKLAYKYLNERDL